MGHEVAVVSCLITQALEQLLTSVTKLSGTLDHVEVEALARTGDRVARAWFESYFSGYAEDPIKVLAVEFVADRYDQLILERDIPFVSFCSHHLLPFIGKAHVGYISGHHFTGLSKLARVVDILSRRLQMQERLTQQILDTLVGGLRPKGAMVVLEASHECMSCRGVKKSGVTAVTSAVSGVFLEQGNNARAEFLALLRR